ncbi:MAG: SAF domain-containing protein [Jatrophihabitantaceae bacterium]
MSTPGLRRSPAHLVLGALLVVVCALGFAVTATRLDHRSSVLAMARPVTVGQVVSAGDLRAVPVSAGVGVDSIPESDSGSVIGRTMAVSLPVGALLTRAELGTASLPGAGDAIAALALKPGQFPPDLTAGAHVRLVATAGTGPQASASVAVPATGWVATVTGVQVLAGGQGSVVTVLLAQADAVRVAALGSGQVSLVVVAGE